jgi:hypothetical protein
MRDSRRVSHAMWRCLLGAMLALALGGCGSSAASLAAQPTSAGAMTATIPAGPPLRDVKVPYLLGVSMDSADDGWAVGYDGHGGAGFALHDQRGVWTKQPLTVQSADAGLSLTPLGAQMISATDGWIYGSIGQNITLPTRAAILHLTNGVWREEALPAGLTALHAVSFVSPTTGWALAYRTRDLNTDAVILKYAAGHWSVETTIGGHTLTTLSMATPTDGMAADGRAIYRYHNGVWAQTTLPASIPVDRFAGVAVVSATEAWALGFYSPPTQCQQDCGEIVDDVLAHYANGVWTQVKDALTLQLEYHDTFDSDEQFLPYPLSATTGGQVWITYGPMAHYSGGQRAAALETGCPSDFWGAAPVPGADEAWLIGSNGQLFHYAVGKVTHYETGAPCIYGIMPQSLEW